MRKPMYKVKELIRMLEEVDPEAFVFRGDSKNILFPIECIHIPDKIDLLEIKDYMHTSISAVIIE